MTSDGVRIYLTKLQDKLLETLQAMDPAAALRRDEWVREEGGGGVSAVLESGELIEKGGVNFSHVRGISLPASATKTRPELANQPFEAMGVSVVFHPNNPHVPCTHMNVRFFRTLPDDGSSPSWWFGGGFDLTPVYPHFADAVAWHRAAKAACDPFGAHLYPQFKHACDQYFRLPHRDETRGIGGLFFDDFNQPDFENAFAFMRSVGDAFMPAWAAIARQRTNQPVTESERKFQLYRRGRYVEFNLLYDRGTLFGLQSGGRTESILMSLPPLAAWTYNFSAAPGSPEERLNEFLRPRDWLAEAGSLSTSSAN